jgi:hypothetical protein
LVRFKQIERHPEVIIKTETGAIVGIVSARHLEYTPIVLYEITVGESPWRQ